jgi:cytochrome P450
MEADRVVDTHSAYSAFSMDVIAEYCYGHCYNFLLEDDFKESWKDSMVNVLENASFRRAVPWLTHFMQMLPTSYVLRLAPSMEILINWQKDIHREVTQIVNSKKKSEVESIFQNLLDNPDLPKEEKTVQRLADEGEILIAAGNETTAKTLSYMTFYILNTPGVLEKLREELKTVMPTAKHMPTWTELEKLPYLTAVIMEGLRISLGMTTRLPRVSHEPLRYKDWVIPARVCSRSCYLSRLSSSYLVLRC